MYNSTAKHKYKNDKYNMTRSVNDYTQKDNALKRSIYSITITQQQQRKCSEKRTWLG